MASRLEQHPLEGAESLCAGRLRFTPEMFCRLGEAGVLDDSTRYELIEGDIYAMPPEGPESVRRYMPDEHLTPLFAPEWAAPVDELARVRD